MRIGIDWVSLVIFLVGYGLSQVRSFPPSVRHALFGSAMAAIAIYRLTMGARGMNLAFVAIAGVLAVTYYVRAFQARKET